MAQSALPTSGAEMRAEDAPPAAEARHDDDGTHIAHARSVQTTWLYTLGSIVFFCLVLDALLLMFAYSAAAEPAAGWLIGLTLAASAMHVRYCWFLQAGRGGGQPPVAWTIALLAPSAAIWLIGFFLPVGDFPAALPLWIALCLFAALLQRRVRRVVLAVGVALVAIHLALASHPPDYTLGFSEDSGLGPLLVYAATFPLMLMSSLWWWEIVVRLDEHRRTAAELAVTRERLRFAADLHDIQGHHLQVIALKAELAERLLAVDPDAARQHLHDTRLIAKEALEETRALVSGYRESALGIELENAQAVLTAAGAECNLTVGTLPADRAVLNAFAMAVREATTNILRHSNATEVSIRFSSTAGNQFLLEVSNNGLVESAERTSGSGLAGLRERFATLGGGLETSLDSGSDRFELRAHAPSGVLETA